jgi:hypothetical protein
MHRSSSEFFVAKLHVVLFRLLARVAMPGELSPAVAGTVGGGVSWLAPSDIRTFFLLSLGQRDPLALSRSSASTVAQPCHGRFVS